MEWISVKERLPEKSGQYWCYDMNEAEISGSCAPWVDMFSESAESFIGIYTNLYGEYVVRASRSVTHWAEMTMPDPPEGDGRF